MAEITLSPSSLYTFQKCERRFYFALKYQILREWNWPLEFGSAVHEVFEAYNSKWSEGLEARVKAGVEKAIEVSSAWEDWRQDNNYNVWNLCRIPVWYAEHYGIDTECEPIGASELTFSIPLENGVIFTGRIDGRVRAMGRYYIIDHKTTSGYLGETFYNRYSPDVQFSAYNWVGRKLWPELKIAGVICNGIQLSAGSVDFDRVPILRTEEELVDFGLSLSHYAKRRLALEGQPIEAWVKNEANCSSCPFRQICTAPKSIRHTFKYLPRDGDGK